MKLLNTPFSRVCFIKYVINELVSNINEVVNCVQTLKCSRAVGSILFMKCNRCMKFHAQELEIKLISLAVAKIIIIK